MSTIQVNEILSRDGTKTLMKLDSGAMSGVNFGRRNLIINGDMQVWQRGTSATGIGNTDTGYHTADRWLFAESAAPTVEYTQSQSTDTPDGFGYSLKHQCTTAESSPASGSQTYFNQKIESQNLQQLKYGTSSARKLTASFWVKANKTGTFGCNLQTFTTSNRLHCGRYTISAADTWEYKTITFNGDTGQSIPNDNGGYLYLIFSLLHGSDFNSGTANTGWEATDNTERYAGCDQIGTSTDDYLAITGVQLEVGEVATQFEYRSYSEELALCQRYYTSSFSGMTTVGGSLPSNSGGRIMAFADSTGDSGDRFAFIHTWPVQMRASPTVVMYGNQWSSGKISVYNGGTSEWTLTRTATGSINGLNSDYLTASGVTSGDMRVAYVTADAEL